MAKRIDENLPADVKNALFVSRHYKQIFIASVSLSIISLFILLITSIRYSSVITTQSQVIKDMANKVIFVRADGRVVQLEKEQLTRDTLLYALRDIVINYVTISAFDIENAKINSEKDFLNVEKIKQLSQFLDPKAFNGVNAFLDMLYNAYKDNALPEVIYTPDLTGMEDSLVYQGGKFEYEIEYPVVAYYVSAQKWNKGKGTIEVKMSGYVDMAKSTPANPLGIYISKFEVTKYVSKQTANNM